MSLPRFSRHDRIVFVGDSLTHGGDWAGLLGLTNSRNAGVPGDTVPDILDRLEGFVEPDPRAYLVMAGINDLNQGQAPPSVAARTWDLLARLRAYSPRSELLLQTLLPVNRDFGDFPADNAAIRETNRLLRAGQTAQARVHLLDLYRHLADAEGALAAAFSLDGVHLTADGYRAWAARLRPLFASSPA